MSHRYVDKAGRVIYTKDRTKGLYPMIDAAKRASGKLSALVGKIRDMKQPRSGRFVWDAKKKRFVYMGPGHVPDIWIGKHRIDADADRRAGYAALESKGKLNEVNDRDVWQRYADRT